MPRKLPNQCQIRFGNCDKAPLDAAEPVVEHARCPYLWQAEAINACLMDDSGTSYHYLHTDLGSGRGRQPQNDRV